MSNEQKQPHGSACPHENIKMGWHGGHPYRFCLDCQMEIRAEQPQEGKPLTAEEYFDRNFVKFKGEYFISQNDFIRFAEQVEHATAALREELQGEKVLFDILINVAKELVAELEAVKKDRNKALDDFGSLQFSSVQKERKHLKELAAVKKENGKMNNVINDLKGELSKVTRQRDEAMKLLKRIKSNLPDNAPWSRDYNTFLSRLSSGEMKVDDINVADLPVTQQEQGEAKPECKMCNGKLMVGHMTTEGGETWPCPECFDNPSNNSSSSTQSPWISVEDRLPEEGIKVLIAEWSCDINGERLYNYTVGSYDGEKGEVAEFTGVEAEAPGTYWPSHWMPLPAPPES